jgi:arsenite methyltransferase
VPPAVRRSMELWVGCVAGALSETEYRSKLAQAGFEATDLEVTRVYGSDDARAFLAAEGIDGEAMASEIDGKFVSAFIRAVKPASCCAPGCCSR